MACTTILVGKDASFDGSTIVARNEDSPSGEFTPKKCALVTPGQQPRHYKSVLGLFEIDLPDNPLRYTSVPDALCNQGIWGAAGINSANIAMSATETLGPNERVLGADPLVEPRAAKGKPGDKDYEPEQVGGIGEEDMLTLVLPYIRSAREGVERLGSLLAQLGTYENNGIAFSDVDEIWWLETVGGHHWIARRVPDNAYVTMPNQLGIDYFDLDDALGAQSEFMCSPDLRDFMERAHLDLTMRCAGAGCADGCAGATGPAGATGADADGRAAAAAARPGIFNPREAFGTADDGDHEYNTPRAWSMQRVLNPHACDWDSTRAGDSRGNLGPESNDIPWCRVPERKLTIADVKYVLSLHFQGTPYDPYARFGDPSLKGRYRCIGISRNCALSVLQLRPGVPASICGIHWVAFGSNVFNALVPFYANVDELPGYLTTTGKDVSTDSFYWNNRLIGALADSHFNVNLPHIERYQLAVGAASYEILNRTDAEIAGLEGFRSEGSSRPDDAAAADAGADATSQDVDARLVAANAAIADKTRSLTAEVLAKVLYTTSNLMKNSFARSDN